MQCVLGNRDLDYQMIYRIELQPIEIEKCYIFLLLALVATGRLLQTLARLNIGLTE